MCGIIRFLTFHSRFVELELIAAVVTTLAQYIVELPPDVLNAGGKGETLDQRRERVLKCKHGNTVTYVRHVVRHIDLKTDTDCFIADLRCVYY